eukprot:scaffold391_cov189-Alexandrium_tamarense.AAC.8
MLMVAVLSECTPYVVRRPTCRLCANRSFSVPSGGQVDRNQKWIEDGQVRGIVSTLNYFPKNELFTVQLTIHRIHHPSSSPSCSLHLHCYSQRCNAFHLALVHDADAPTTQSESDPTINDDGVEETSNVVDVEEEIKGIEYLRSSLKKSSHPTEMNMGAVDTKAWEILQQSADVCRALIITCCLLLEILPDAATSLLCDATDSNTDTSNQLQWEHLSKDCPLLCTNSIPPYSPTVEKQILSSARRSILLLQSLEKVCAAKTIAKRHSASDGLSTASFYTGDDDIHDYDRSIADLYSNYDWHDDGFLPRPCSYCSGVANTSDGKTGVESSMLHYCCYLPCRYSDPPSSMFERNAWTRDCIRGDRLISLSLEDYAYHENSGRNVACDVDAEYLRAPWMQIMECDDDDEIDEAERELNDVNITSFRYNENETQHLHDDEEEENPFFSLSPVALAKEEASLLDIMVPSQASTPSQLANGTSSHDKTNTRRLKRRRRNKKQSHNQQHGNKQWSGGDCGLNKEKSAIYTKEGFLLLVHHGNVQRVYARLHPSGWLSVEDRSIRDKNAGEAAELNTLQPLVHRTRYWDYFIQPDTSCNAWTPNGANSFHFRLNKVILLGSSSLKPGEEESVNHQTSTVDLLFGVDGVTGGTIMDGFEWVCALSGAASSYSELYTLLAQELGPAYT